MRDRDGPQRPIGKAQGGANRPARVCQRPGAGTINAGCPAVRVVMIELVLAIILGGIAFVVLAVVVKTLAVAIVGGVVVFIAAGFGRRVVQEARGRRRL